MPPVQPPIDRGDVGTVVADVDMEMSAQARFKPPARMMQSNRVVICSIWPEELISNPRSRGGQGAYRYHLAAGSVEKPSYLAVEPTYDIIFNPASPPDRPAEGTMGGIPAAIEAASLVQFWAGDHYANAAGKKGVGIIEGEKATSKEIQDLQRSQENWLKYMVNQADRYWRSNKPNEIEKINNEHRRALKMLGLDYKLHPWYQDVVQVYSQCPWCESSVKSFAIFCSTCHKDIAPYYIERGIEVDAKALPKVAEEIVRIKKQKVA